MKMLFLPNFRKQQGSMLVYSVSVIFIFAVVLLAVLAYATVQLRLVRSSKVREAAFHIAESGANYYQWHLAHFTSDYADGTGQTGCSPCGPYVHDFIDTDTNKKIGEYSLLITPPLVGSTITTITSTGYLLENPNIKRTVTVRHGIPSLAKYSYFTNTDIWIGGGVVSGQLHANGGIRFDGTGDAPITSAKTTYTCQTYHGCSPAQTKPGIWGAAGAATKAFWQFPIPNLDFSSMTSDLANIKTAAQTNGYYLPPSSAYGYSVVFNSNGTMTIYKINSLLYNPSGYGSDLAWHSDRLSYNSRSVVSGYNNVSLPANGIIFLEDRTWVEGTINGRATVVAAKLPYNSATAPSIVLANNILYSAKDGSSALGLIAQKDVLFAYNSPSTIEVDAALVAQNGAIQHYYYPGQVKNGLVWYGSSGSYGISATTWVNGSGQVIGGFRNSTSTYDSNLLYGPPPSYPLAADGYEILSWSSN